MGARYDDCTLILPGFGTVIGGFLRGVGGSLLGEKFGAVVGSWTKTLVVADVPGKMLDAWNSTMAFIGGAWASIATDAKATLQAVSTKAGEWFDAAKVSIEPVGKTPSGAGNAVNVRIKAKIGFDAREIATNTIHAMGEAASAPCRHRPNLVTAGL